MTMQNDGKASKGRSWDQVTAGTTSAGTMGAGATGDVGSKAESKDKGSQQQGEPGSLGRTDDLLSGGGNDEQSDKGFQSDAGNAGGGNPKA